MSRVVVIKHRFSTAVVFIARSCPTLSPVSIGIGDCLRAGIPPWYVTKPTRSAQPCTPLGLLNRVPALIGWGKVRNVTSAGWQVTLRDSIWNVSSRSGAVLVAQTTIRFFLPLPSNSAVYKLTGNDIARLLWLQVSCLSNKYLNF